MHVSVTKTGKVKFKSKKLKYEHKINLGDVLTVIVDLAILFAIYHVS